MDLNLLPLLDTLLTTQSLTATSKKHGIGVPAVSRSLSRLRKEYGDPLLIRSGNRMILSAFAAAISHDVTTCVTQCGIVGRTNPSQAAINMPRTFRIASTDVFGAILSSSIAQRCQSRPNITIRLVAEERVTWDALRSGQVDLAAGGVIDLPGEAVVKHLFRDGLVGIIRRGHPLIKLKSVFGETRQVIAENQLPFEAENIRAWRQAGFERRIAMEVPSFFAAAATVEATDFMATVPALLAAELKSRYQIEIIPLPLRLPPISVRLAWHPRYTNDPVHRWLREEVATIGRRLVR